VKLGIGTAQFGMDYGISNSKGKVSPKEVALILEFAQRHNVSFIDTAPLYMESERVLGRTLPIPNSFKIVTKTPKGSSASVLVETFKKSLETLRQKTLYALLIHNGADLLSADGKSLYDSVVRLKEQGLVEKIGFSAYGESEIDQVTSRYKIDLVQIPLNIFDQRLIQSGTLKRLKELGVEIHARSIFLQGLLLMDTERLPKYFSNLESHVNRYREKLKELSISPLEAAIGFVAQVDEVDVAIVGVDNALHFEEIWAASKKNITFGTSLKEFSLNDASILNPSKWVIN
jgi:aryl-alcohol dehydrogenase-like predicted oxidoreductase